MPISSPDNKQFAFGGGVQSTAALVLSATGKLDYSTFLFANVGDDSENPHTISYVNEVAIPYAEEHGITIISLSRPESILSHVLSPDNSSIVIPVRSAKGGFGNRACTNHWKRKIISSWQRERGASKLNPFTLGIGISFDELHRMKTDSGSKSQIIEYPLVDKRLTRKDCTRIISSQHLPVPPKSSCWFCPFKSKSEWFAMRRNDPSLFDKASSLEKSINEKRLMLGHNMPVYLHEPDSLEEAIYDDESYFEEPVCESGYCFI